MKKCLWIVSLLLLSALLVNRAAWAQQKGPLELTVVAEQEKEVINVQGKKELKRVPVTKVFPGDEVIYTLHYANTSRKAVNFVTLNNPVPEHMVYSEGSAKGKDTVIMFSVDKGKTYQLPQKLFVTTTDGLKRPARAADYTNIRWTLQRPLGPGEKGTVSFRARLK